MAKAPSYSTPRQSGRSTSSRTRDSLTIKQTADAIEQWILDGDNAEMTERALLTRREVAAKLLWFLRDRECPACGTEALRAFFSHLRHGHEEPDGRWGNPRCRKVVRPTYVHKFYRTLRTLFLWCVRQGMLDTSPLAAVTAPIVRSDQIQPFSESEVQALLAAAARSRDPKRDQALLLLMLDTGARAAEVCGLTREQLDLTARRCRVLGKGNKERVLPLGKATTRALWVYLRGDEDRDGRSPLFPARRGPGAGQALTPNGLLQLFERLGKAAKLSGVRCSPHTARHTFAISFLRAGADVYSMQACLGHESLEMVRRYVQLAEADVAQAHRRFSPMDQLAEKSRRK